MRATLSAVATLLTLAAGPATAGIADSPLPAPFTQHVFSVPSVIDNGPLSTFFSCTNVDHAPVTIGVEWFNSASNLANIATDTALSVAPGATVMFGIRAATGIVVHAQLGGGPTSTGSARILATSKKIACAAFIADIGSSPPTSAWQLTIIAKTKQKAAN